MNNDKIHDMIAKAERVMERIGTIQVQMGEDRKIEMTGTLWECPICQNQRIVFSGAKPWCIPCDRWARRLE